LPVAITRNGAERVMHSAVTKNISSGGVLFTAGKEFDLGGSIEYVITLGGPTEQRISLRCIGKVLRHKKVDEEDASVFDIAATLERYEFVRSDN
jgi:hypothetical protein